MKGKKNVKVVSLDTLKQKMVHVLTVDQRNMEVQDAMNVNIKRMKMGKKQKILFAKIVPPNIRL